eukprot:1758823-Amphidinium_carterae.1
MSGGAMFIIVAWMNTQNKSRYTLGGALWPQASRNWGIFPPLSSQVCLESLSFFNPKTKVVKRGMCKV